MPRVLKFLASAVLMTSTWAALSIVPAASAPAGPTLPPPSSMAAVGDSFTRGFATGAPDCSFFGPCPQYSWSTGTAVNSHYQRLLALNPALSGNATNAAVPGAQIPGLSSQMAAITVQQPDYVTVLLGGGDICFATTTPTQFAAHFRAGMDTLFATSPDSHVLVASIWNFESMRSAVLAGNPSATWSFCGTFFNASSADRAALVDRIVQYNAALATECATYANCLFDGNALFDHVWTSAEVSTIDNVHPSVAGQEMISQVLFDAGYRWAVEPPNAPPARRAAGPGSSTARARRSRTRVTASAMWRAEGRTPPRAELPPTPARPSGASRRRSSRACPRACSSTRSGASARTNSTSWLTTIIVPGHDGERLARRGARRRVEVVGRLVEQQQVVPAGDELRERELRLLAARERGRVLERLLAASARTCRAARAGRRRRGRTPRACARAACARPRMPSCSWA